MATLQLTTDNFDQTVTGDKIVIIDFWAPWCGPCRSFAPVFEAAAEKHPDIVFAKINTEEEQQLAASFNIRSIPTLMVFREQVIVFSQPGALPASGLEEVIDGARKLDMAEVHAQIARAEEGKTAQA